MYFRSKMEETQSSHGPHKRYGNSVDMVRENLARENQIVDAVFFGN